MKLKKNIDRKMFKAQRERTRMMEINQALIFLRIVLQNCITKDENGSEFEHLPKIEVLKLAINYIAFLELQVQGQEFTNTDYISMLSVNLKNSTIKMLKRALRHL